MVRGYSRMRLKLSFADFNKFICKETWGGRSFLYTALAKTTHQHLPVIALSLAPDSLIALHNYTHSTDVCS